MTFVTKFFILDTMEEKEEKKNGTFDRSGDLISGRTTPSGGNKRMGMPGACSFACADICRGFQLCGKWQSPAGAFCHTDGRLLFFAGAFVFSAAGLL